MKWMDQEIVEWHKKTFPNCTLEEQVLKVGEEVSEMILSIVNEEGEDRFKEELADVYIASLVSKERFGVDYHFPIFREKIEDVIEKKMEVNCQREWEKVDGVYRHKKVLT